jgi:hypothetical protein
MSLLLEESWKGKKCSIQFRYDVRREIREESSVYLCLCYIKDDGDCKIGVYQVHR